MWAGPKKDFEPYPNPKNSPLGPHKAKNDPKIRSTLKVRIQGSTENKSYSDAWVDPKNVLSLTPTPPKKKQKQPQIKVKTKIQNWSQHRK